MTLRLAIVTRTFFSAEVTVKSSVSCPETLSPVTEASLSRSRAAVPEPSWLDGSRWTLAS